MTSDFSKSMLKQIFCLTLLPVLVLGVFSSQAQTLIAGTSFDPVPGKENEYYIAADNIQHYGAVKGNLIMRTPWHSGMLSTFDNKFQYLVADNPLKIDSARFKDIPDYMLLVSSPSVLPAPILTYSVPNLVPGSPVSITISFCSIVDPAKAGTSNPNFVCSGQPTGFKLTTPAGPNMIDRDYQLFMGACTTIVVTGKAESSGELTINLQHQRSGSRCLALGISKIEVTGTLKTGIYSEQGSEVCVGETLKLGNKMQMNGTFQWQMKTSGSWVNLGTAAEQVYDMTETGNYMFRNIFTPAGGTTSYTSDTLNIHSLVCCTDSATGQPFTRKTIFYDDFGTFDIAGDPAGRTYKVWDYSDPVHPRKVTRTTPVPFRYALDQEPAGSVFKATGPVIDGEYTVAGYITGYQSYKGIEGARLAWAGNITGKANAPVIAYDHSGTPEGAALIINLPFNSQGSVIYKRDFDLCVEDGTPVYVEAFIAVAAASENGNRISVKLTGGLAPVVLTAESCRQGGTCPNPGKWVRISGMMIIHSKTLTMEIINDAPNEWNQIGNELVLDDIRIMSCSQECTLTGVTENKTIGHALLAPNPASDIVSLGPDVDSYLVYDAYGNLQATGSEKHLAVKNWKPGVYNVRLSLTNGKVVSHKFIKE